MERKRRRRNDVIVVVVEVIVEEVIVVGEIARIRAEIAIAADEGDQGVVVDRGIVRAAGGDRIRGSGRGIVEEIAAAGITGGTGIGGE